ncbi:hypothetical protein NC651_039180 [Populus alba x Populus x berolinensis]|nr:hypothetical protein NC651_039180 [Populus alba x Populus x berolinensis]
MPAGVAVIPLALRVHNRDHWFYLALVVLVSACPCALILSTPIATFCALTRAATAGLLIKGRFLRVSSIESKSSHPMAAAL